MSGILLVVLILIIWSLIQFANLYLWNKKVNRIINISLLISLLILPDSIACIIFLILVLRLIAWLFGPGQDMTDYYYYSRYENAKKRYEKRREKRR